MTPDRTDDTFRRAGLIIEGSRVAALFGVVVARIGAGVSTSRALALVRSRAREFEALPAADWTWCVVLLIAVALAGHAVMAALLPWPARQAAAPAAAALLAASLAAVAAISRS